MNPRNIYDYNCLARYQWFIMLHDLLEAKASSASSLGNPCFRACFIAWNCLELWMIVLLRMQPVRVHSPPILFRSSRTVFSASRWPVVLVWSPAAVHR